MKIIKYILIFLLGILAIANLCILIPGNFFIYKALIYNFVNIDDYKIFENRTIPKSTHPEKWPLAMNYNKVPLTDSLERTLKRYESVAFLIIKNDSICHEQYWEGYDKNSLSNSFSMAKSVISMLIGIALQEGKIKSIDQPVGDFIPAFQEGEKAKITIKDLLMMSSGLNWDESKSYKNVLSVFSSDIMEGYYGTDLYKHLTSLSVAEKPGVYFDYKSGDTQLLAFILKMATGQSISTYFSEKIWEVVGAENDALWSLDKENGDEKAFCCLNSDARDFARLGKLYLNKGQWNNAQVVDSNYVKESTRSHGTLDKDDTSRKVNFYGYQFWIIPQRGDKDIFYMRGTLGQFVIVIPSQKTIIVRLGKAHGPKYANTKHYAQTLIFINETLKMYPN